MSQPTTGIGFSASIPTAPAGYQIAKPQTDGAQPLSRFDFVTPSTGGVSAKTANYTATAADCGKLIAFEDSSPVASHTLTLPSTPPFVQWQIAVQNIGAGTLTISRNGLLIDTAAANLTIAQGSGVVIYTDGTNYFTERGAGYTSPLTTKGDLLGHSTVDARVPVGTNGQSLVADSTQALGVRWTDRISTVGITIDGGGSPPTAGLKGIIQIPFAGTIIGWSALADVSGSASLDIWKVASSAPPSAPVIPTSGNKISASAPVALSSAQSASAGSSGVSTWTTAVAQWDTFGFNLASATTLTRITIVLQITRS